MLTLMVFERSETSCISKYRTVFQIIFHRKSQFINSSLYALLICNRLTTVQRFRRRKNAKAQTYEMGPH